MTIWLDYLLFPFRVASINPSWSVIQLLSSSTLMLLALQTQSVARFPVFRFSREKDKEGSITITGWIQMLWNDTFLCWDPAAYANITYIVVPAEKVWRPDMGFSSAIDRRFFDIQNLPVLIWNYGTVDFSPGEFSTHSCNMDATLFPFDTQTCSFVLQAWYSGAELISLRNKTFMYEKGMENKVWDVVATTSHGGEIVPDMVSFKLTIKRKPLYYVTYIILPLLMMALLNLSVFWLPASSGERISLSITVLLTLYVLLITINDFLPVSSTSTPLLTIYTASLICISTLSTMATVFAVRINHYEHYSYPIPPWVIKFLRLNRRLKGNKIEVIHEQDASSSELLPSWPEVSAAVDKLSFFVFLVIECLITLSIVLCYVQRLAAENLDSP